MKLLKRWLRVVNVNIPAPLAGAALVLVFTATLLAMGVDWWEVGLPPRGAPGRRDVATEKYYKQYRLRLEAHRKRWLEQHPQYQKYSTLPPEEMMRRIRQDEQK